MAATARKRGRPSRDSLDPATRYAKDVVAGRYVVGKLLRLACERHLRDLKRSKRKAFPWTFDPGRAELFFRYCRLLYHTTGQFGQPSAYCAKCDVWSASPRPRPSGRVDELGAAIPEYGCHVCDAPCEVFHPEGRPFELEPWQMFIAGALFGWVHKATGLRRFTHAYIQIARKNGKSTFAAALASFLAFFDGEMGAQVYTLATTRYQARIVFDEATKQLRRMEKSALRQYSSRGLLEGVELMTHKVRCVATGSKLEPLSSDYGTLDGLNTHGAVIDEFHEIPRGLYEVIDNSTGARTQALVVMITTAGNDKGSVCFAHREKSIGVLNQTLEFETWFAFIAEPDDGDEDRYQDRDVMAKANPNLDVSVYATDLVEKAKSAALRLDEKIGFLNKRLNMWTEQSHRAIEIPIWRSQGKRRELRELVGERCSIGVDLSEQWDFTAVVVAFMLDGGFELFPFFWVPEENLEELERRTTRPFRQWAASDFLRTFEGNVADHRVIERFIIDEISRRFRVVEVTFDPHLALGPVNTLNEAGVKAATFPQSGEHYTSAVGTFLALHTKRALRHGGHPILEYCAECVSLKETESRGRKRLQFIRTDSKSQRIDGIIAAMMAIYRNASLTGDTSKDHVYKRERRGLRTLPM